MSTHSVMTGAEIRTGLRDWGEQDFIPRLDAWTRAIRSDWGLTIQARASLDGMADLYARNRLKLEALIATHPEIEAIELPAPIVITGLPRSGTTALATLIASHPGLRSLTYAEVLDPFGEPVKRIRRADAESDAAEKLMPGLRRFHDTRAHAHADDHWLMAMAFSGLALDDWAAVLPNWRAVYLAEDQTPVYRYLKRALQAMTYLRGPNRWVIKSPGHVEQLPALKAVFPDALLVVTIRDREAVDYSMRRVTDFIAGHMRKTSAPIGYWRERFDAMAECYARDRDLFPERIELQLADWRLDPEGTARRIWSPAGLVGAELQAA